MVEHAYEMFKSPSQDKLKKTTRLDNLSPTRPVLRSVTKRNFLTSSISSYFSLSQPKTIDLVS